MTRYELFKYYEDLITPWYEIADKEVAIAIFEYKMSGYPNPFKEQSGIVRQLEEMTHNYD